MAKLHVQMLENTISTNVNTIFNDIPPTEEEFMELANNLRVSTSTIMPVSDHEFEQLRY